MTRSTLSTLEVDVALLSMSWLTCGTWSLEWNIVLTLSLMTQHIVYQLCWWVVHVSDQSCFFIQHRVAVRVTPTCSVKCVHVAIGVSPHPIA